MKNFQLKSDIKPVIWCIGGADTRAGAGIQADLLTANDLEVCCATLVSAVTAQSSDHVSHISAVSDATFQQQIHSAAEDALPSVIKVGLLARQSQVNLLREWLLQNPAMLICDPVQIASNGDSLVSEHVDLRPLLPLCTLITPNQDELGQLESSLPLEFLTDNVLLTGLRGNADNKITERLRSVHHTEDIFWQHDVIETSNTHGTGCTLATAIACGLAKGFTLLDSISLAIAYVQHGLHNKGQSTSNFSVAHRGWPSQPKLWPIAYSKNPAAIGAAKTAFAPLQQALGFYPVVNSLALVKALIDLGVNSLQLRIKGSSATPGLREELAKAIAYARQHKAQLFINDHWRLACELQAYGVHLGQEDLAQADLDTIKKTGLRLGTSTHGFYEMCCTMHLQPSYLALGHIFPTPTKDMPSKPQGLEKLKYYAELSRSIPSVAIGGIDHSNAVEVLRCGVDSIAVVRAVTQSSNLEQTITIFKECFQGAQVAHNILSRVSDEALCE